jgi:hypothetical protein
LNLFKKKVNKNMKIDVYCVSFEDLPVGGKFIIIDGKGYASKRNIFPVWEKIKSNVTRKIGIPNDREENIFVQDLDMEVIQVCIGVSQNSELAE